MKTLIAPALAGLIVIHASMTHAGHGQHQSPPVAESKPSTSLLSAEQLVAQVLEKNAGLAQLQSAIEADRARSNYAGELPDPTFSGAFAPETLGGFDTPSGRERGTNVRLEISQRLPWPGKLALQSQAALADVAVAKQSVDGMRLKLSEQTRQAYAEWVYAHEALRINEQHQALVEELRSSAETRYSAGLASQQDVLQAEVQQQHLRHQQFKLQRLRRAIQARINALLSNTENAVLGSPAPLTELPELSDYPTLKRSALAQHPELLRIAKQMDGSSLREALAEKDFYPDFNLFTGYNSLWDDPNKRWVVGAGINLPINRDKYRSRLDEARARTQQLRYALTDEKARLLSELEQAHAAAVEADHNLALYRNEVLPLSEENLSAARAEYGSGGGAFSDVIDAEQTRLMAQLEEARSRSDAFIARAALARWSAAPIAAKETAMENDTAHSITASPTVSENIHE